MMEQLEMEQLFEHINEARIAMLEATEELRQQLEEPQLLIASIEAEISDVMAPYAEIIDALKLDIETAVLINEASIKTDAGTCTYVKGRKPSVKWNDDALMGYAATHDEVLQFRSEGKQGLPTTRFKFVDV